MSHKALHTNVLFTLLCTLQVVLIADDSATEQLVARMFTSPARAAAKYCDEHVCLYVCLSVCLSDRISPEPHARSLPNFSVHATYGRGSVLRPPAG